MITVNVRVVRWESWPILALMGVTSCDHDASAQAMSLLACHRRYWNMARSEPPLASMATPVIQAALAEARKVTT